VPSCLDRLLRYLDNLKMPATPLPLLPSDADLRRMVHFSAGDGRIWLANQRMLLVHAAALGALRGELMRTIGREQTRRLLLRAGFASGAVVHRCSTCSRSARNCTCSKARCR
jgi:Activator of aromatic catabolism